MAGEATWRCGYCLRVAGKCQRHGNSPVCDGCREYLASRGKKFCATCQTVKLVADFPGNRARCRPCVAAARRELQRAYMATWRTTNREQRIAYRAAYEAAYPEQAKAWRDRAHVNQKMRKSSRLRSQGDTP
jgi:hypothetical protein